MRSKSLARLLSGRNEPSVLEKEALFARIASDPPRWHWRSWALRLSLATSFAGALAAAVVLHHMHPSTIEPREFESRGAGTTGPTLRLACVNDAHEVPCTMGRTLTFEVGAVPAASRFFASFAKRSDGAIIWYFPTPEGRSEAIDTTQPVLAQAVRLGPPHTPGDYAIYAVFTAQPRTRAELKEALGKGVEPKDGVLVIERHLMLGDGT